MSDTFSELTPAALWQNFAALNAIPRASKKEEAVIQFMIDFGNRLNLPASRDGRHARCDRNVTPF